MTLLLDTHVVLWWLSDDPRLGRSVVERIQSNPDVVVSAASVWEISIKRALGKLEVVDDYLPAIAREGFRPLPISMEHAARAGGLPPHHRDPFDRMLVAQAQIEDLRIVTSDRRIEAYDVAVASAS